MMRAADVDDGAVHQYHPDAEKVVRGHPVLEAMRATRVHGDVAGDGAGKLARRVGGIEEAVLRDRAGDGDVGAPGLHRGSAVGVVDLQDVHSSGLRRAPRVGGRQRAAGKRGARTARHHGNPLPRGTPQDRRDFLGRRREHRQSGRQR